MLRMVRARGWELPIVVGARGADPGFADTYEPLSAMIPTAHRNSSRTFDRSLAHSPQPVHELSKCVVEQVQQLGVLLT
jgi:hypothetical protein